MSEIEVREYEELLCSSMMSDNVELLDELIDDDLIFVTHEGNIIRKEEDLASHRSKKVNISSMEVKEMHVKHLDNIAVTVSRVAMKGQLDNGQPIDGEYCYTRIWKQEKGKMKVVCGHCSMNKTAQ